MADVLGHARAEVATDRGVLLRDLVGPGAVQEDRAGVAILAEADHAVLDRRDVREEQAQELAAVDQHAAEGDLRPVPLLAARRLDLQAIELALDHRDQGGQQVDVQVRLVGDLPRPDGRTEDVADHRELVGVHAEGRMRQPRSLAQAEEQVGEDAAREAGILHQRVAVAVHLLDAQRGRKGDAVDGPRLTHAAHDVVRVGDLVRLGLPGGDLGAEREVADQLRGALRDRVALRHDGAVPAVVDHTALGVVVPEIATDPRQRLEDVGRNAVVAQDDEAGTTKCLEQVALEVIAAQPTALLPALVVDHWDHLLVGDRELAPKRLVLGIVLAHGFLRMFEPTMPGLYRRVGILSTFPA